MPYIITAKQPADVTATSFTSGTEYSSRAVATLDEAREAATDLATHHGVGDSYSIDEAHGIIANLPESGGTVGPLPDGTVIEVQHVKWEYLLEHGPAGVIERYPGDGGQPLLDAFNAEAVR